MEKEYITPEEAKDVLKCTLATVHNYKREGLLTKYLIRKKVVFSLKEVEGLLVPRKEVSCEV